MLPAIRHQLARLGTLRLFVALQCLDGLTTLLFLSSGVAEGNPLVSWALAHSYAPWTGLVFTKLIAVAIASTS